MINADNLNDSAYLGFIRGNYFDNLYSPYKNYQYKDINPKNEKEYLMLMISVYNSAAHDLTLYLDVNPDDTNAIKIRNEYINLYKNYLNDYENKYGALNLSSSVLEKSPWNWDLNNFPWEGDVNV